MFLRIRNSGRGVLIVSAVMALVVSFACGKKSGAEKAFSVAKQTAEALAPSNANGQNDYTKPYLTDEKMTRFIESLQEDVNPFEVLFKGGSMMRAESDIVAKAKEFDRFAQKYGFENYGDYMAVWGRIMVGDMMVASEQMKKDTIKMMEETIRTAEESLKKPDLSPEMRTMFEEQIKSSKASIEEFQKPDETSGLNAADLALVAKYKAQIDEATKKFKKNPGT
ncbi:MAG TPA: hypothetical protein VHP61_03050 [Acidobacteriota bacterium]|nr:hypothetical protein [Acidobacteriota bacterium]